MDQEFVLLKPLFAPNRSFSNVFLMAADKGVLLQERERSLKFALS